MPSDVLGDRLIDWKRYSKETSDPQLVAFKFFGETKTKLSNRLRYPLLFRAENIFRDIRGALQDSLYTRLNSAV